MELFLELTRRCNLQCSHCLRGEAQGKDMSETTIWHALRTLGGQGYIGIGGGESLMSDKHLRKLRNAVLQTGEYKSLETLYLVTNGRRIIENSVTRMLLADFPADTISLHVSTDQWHEDDAKYNHSFLDHHFEWNDKINVYKHGPDAEYHIVNMGRAGRGKDLVLYPEDYMLYVDVNGYVWGSCDLSYTFMAKNRDKAICYGNVKTDSNDTIMTNHRNLSEYLEYHNKGMKYNEDKGGYTRTYIELNKVELKEAI